jgi:general secretion pathway protein I
MSRITQSNAGFTLLEVLIAIGVLGIALMALLSLHHEDLQSVIRAQEISRAEMLAQTLMTQAELRRWPPLGTTKGDFSEIYPKQYPNYRWEQAVTKSAAFPDLRKVEVRIYYGPNFDRSFNVVEFLHDPMPQINTIQNQEPQNPALQGGAPGQGLGSLGGPGATRGGPLGMPGPQ